MTAASSKDIFGATQLPELSVQNYMFKRFDKISRQMAFAGKTPVEFRAWRKRHRLRLASVARRAKLSREALRKLENGQAWFSMNVAARLCDAMGLDWLYANGEACRRNMERRAKKCQL